MGSLAGWVELDWVAFLSTFLGLDWVGLLKYFCIFDFFHILFFYLQPAARMQSNYKLNRKIQYIFQFCRNPCGYLVTNFLPILLDVLKWSIFGEVMNKSKNNPIRTLGLVTWVGSVLITFWVTLRWVGMFVGWIGLSWNK